MYADEIAACPKHGDRFGGTVGKETDKQAGHARNAQRAPQAKHAGRADIGAHALHAVPHRQGAEEDQHDAALNIGDKAVAVVPDRVRERIAHQHGADDRADAPEAVQPAHVARLIMQRHIVIERRVDRARTETVRHGEGEQHPELCGNRKTEESEHREEHARGRHAAGAELSRELIRQKARSDRPAGDYHGHNAHVRHRNAELRVHDRPAGAEQRIRQTEADKRKIDKCQQQRIHILYHLDGAVFIPPGRRSPAFRSHSRCARRAVPYR